MHDVLVIGGGGREHALGWKLAQSPHVQKLYFAPGNGGTIEFAENVDIPLSDHDAVIHWVKRNGVSFVVVAPDDFLAAGMVDSLTQAGIDCFGPTRAASQIEWSKAYAKEVMVSAGVPTAHYRTFSDFNDAKEYVFSQSFPLAIKASGLALGKGVVIAEDEAQAVSALEDFMVNAAHGEAGKEVVIEEYLEGAEFSVHVITDGTTAYVFPPSQDHKRVLDGDKGPNTGGMGTIAPLPWVTDRDMEVVMDTIVSPLLRELEKRGRPFKGLLYPGLMMTKNGPKVIEFNARFGDPETQSYMRLLESDLFECMQASAKGNLSSIRLAWKKESAACIILASGGYPGPYKKGKEILGLQDAETIKGVVVFHAGTKKEGKMLQTNGGRVLNVTALGNSLSQALERAYQAIEKISFEGKQFRTDIGKKSL